MISEEDKRLQQFGCATKFRGGDTAFGGLRA